MRKEIYEIFGRFIKDFHKIYNICDCDLTHEQMDKANTASDKLLFELIIELNESKTVKSNIEVLSDLIQKYPPLSDIHIEAKEKLKRLIFSLDNIK